VRRRLSVFLCVLGVLGGGVLLPVLHAQIDPRQMAGIPRPVNDLPDASISVRLIRGQLSNNIASHLVELHFANGRVVKVNTDEAGRAQFDRVPPGVVKASADVDGEHLESQEFEAPKQGGIRLMLVATDRTAGASPAAAPAVPGTVTLSENSRIVFEPGDEDVAVYYILEIINRGSAPVNPTPPFTFDMPKGALGTTLLDGSSPIVRTSGAHVSLAGPIPPGKTIVQLVAEMPIGNTGALDITQTFPASMDRLAVLVKKVGETKLSSPTIERQQDFPNDGQVVIGAMGGTIPPGKPIELHLIDLPHHSPAPRYTALSLAGVVLLAGVWAATRKQDVASIEAERKRLVTRREKLFGELLKIERERRGGRSDERHASRREEIMAQLEHIYGALDDPDAAPATA
jgi:hypothetical protein